MYFRHVYMTFVFNWESYVYSAAFLLLLLSEICEGQTGPSGVLHDVLVKIKGSHLYKHCFPVHLPRQSNPASVDDVTACSYANNSGVVSPVFRLPSNTKACGQWWTSLSLLLMGNSKCALRSYRNVTQCTGSQVLNEICPTWLATVRVTQMEGFDRWLHFHLGKAIWQVVQNINTNTKMVLPGGKTDQERHWNRQKDHCYHSFHTMFEVSKSEHFLQHSFLPSDFILHELRKD